MNINVTQEELEELKETALRLYNNENIFNLTSDAFWGKAVLSATQEMLQKKGIEIKIEYPSTYPYQVKS